MSAPSSRYSAVSTAIFTDSDGQEVVYLRRRFLPDPESLALLAVHTVVGGDRAELIAARYLGDPDVWWRIADANDVHEPAALTSTLGRRLRITLPPGVPGPTDA